jgi:hypothetical protein
MRALLAIALVACGNYPGSPESSLAQPNTHQACARAVRCGVFAESEYSACVACLEHVDPVVLNKLREEYGDLPPLDQVDCDTLRTVCSETTNVAECVHEKWYGA